MAMTGHVHGAPTQLELTHRLDISRRKIRRQRRDRIDTRTQDNKIIGRGILFGRGTATHLHSTRAQILDRRFQQRFFLGAVENRDIGALASKQERRGRSAQARSQHRNFFPWYFTIYLSFRVANPSSAKMADRIQNRTMTVFSFQPLSSK